VVDSSRIGVDLLKGKIGAGRGWVRDLVFGARCPRVSRPLSAGAVVFSRFYLTPAADNWFFAGSRVWAYFSAPTGDPRLTTFGTMSGMESSLRGESVRSRLGSAFVDENSAVG